MFPDGSDTVEGGVADLDPGAVDDVDLAAWATDLERRRTLLDAEEAAVLGELDARGVCDRDHGLATAGWLARESHLPAAVAKTRVGVAAKLRRHLPDIAAALAAGTISWDHARVIVELANPRIIDVVAANQQLLVGLADRCRFEQWRAEVRALARMWDQDGGYDPNEDPAANKLSYGSTLDGLTTLAATLTGDNAEVVTQAIETRADELFRRATADHHRCGDLEVPARATLRALALTELIRQALGIDLDTTRGPETEATLVVDAAEPTVASNPDGVRLADGTTRVLLCDAVLQPLIVNGLGVALDHGRRFRLAQEAQRRATRRRDGGCAFPGCGAKVMWCDVHHCVHWDHGGVTDQCNLVCLCRSHHGVVHRTGWSVRVDADGWAIFTSPSGRSFWGQRHGRQREGPAPDPTGWPDHQPEHRHSHGAGPGPAGSFIAPGRYHRTEDPLVMADARQRTLARLDDLTRRTA